jgi:mRNA interferase RelE/StbE
LTYRVEIDRRARKALAGMHPVARARVLAAVTTLGEDPRPPGAIQLKGSPTWRVRVGDYRIIYDIDDGVLTVLVLDLGHRREIYRG